MKTFSIDGTPILVPDLYSTVFNQVPVILGNHVTDKADKNRQYLDAVLSGDDKVIYGINTGFGSLCNVRIPDADLEKLQENLVISHACGMGPLVPEHLCRMMLLLKIINLSKGCSGVRPLVLEKLTELYNNGVIPVIYEQGSLGASGDLAPLAHLSLPLIGQGQVYFQGNISDASAVLKDQGIDIISLAAKEGLALLNGTQFSLAYATVLVHEALQLFHIANHIAALSMDAYQCDRAPLHPLIHSVRNHRGQIRAAEEILSLLEGSEIGSLPRQSVQDPYSFRCVPQVHGASYHAIMHALETVQAEINAVTDNPLIFEDEEQILSGGNFHAQPLAFILDYLAIAMAELGSISERRVYQLINGDRGLPAFLTAKPGLDSGFMIAQYTAASIVSQNKQLCTPASVDSIVSSKGQEDHVSMAANAATKGYRVLQNLKSLLGIELLTATQALEFRRPHKSSAKMEQICASLRRQIPFMEADRVMYPDLHASVAYIEKWIQNESF